MDRPWPDRAAAGPAAVPLHGAVPVDDARRRGRLPRVPAEPADHGHLRPADRLLHRVLRGVADPPPPGAADHSIEAAFVRSQAMELLAMDGGSMAAVVFVVR